MDQQPRAVGGEAVQDGGGRWVEIISSLPSRGVMFQAPMYDVCLCLPRSGLGGETEAS